MGEKKTIKPKNPKKKTQNDVNYRNKLSKENEKIIKLISSYKN